MILIAPDTFAIRTALLFARTQEAIVCMLPSIEAAKQAFAETEKALQELLLTMPAVDKLYEQTDLDLAEYRAWLRPTDTVSPYAVDSIPPRHAIAAWWCLGQ